MIFGQCRDLPIIAKCRPRITLSVCARENLQVAWRGIRCSPSPSNDLGVSDASVKAVIINREGGPLIELELTPRSCRPSKAGAGSGELSLSLPCLSLLTCNPC